jgi:LSD1 subclass zinc finger protein
MADQTELDQTQDAVTSELKCHGCAAILRYAPGTKKLVCTYCGAENSITDKVETIAEIDYEHFITDQYEREEKISVATVKCTTCGATVTFPKDVTADHCPYCSANIVLKSGSTSLLLKPKSLVPFAIDKPKALGMFQKWLASRWFAPTDLKNRASSGQIDGVYIPYWTYDAQTRTEYTGERGDYYYTSESYTEQEDGRSVTKTREVRHTRWSYAAGTVSNAFDDLLVPATTALPPKYITHLEPWGLQALVPFNEPYLSGFHAQSYQVDVKDGLTTAKQLMEPTIEQTIRRNIGGDEQRIGSRSTAYANVTFKHILLPIWISSYRYGAKLYHFLVNGQSGKVQGERPYSAAKIMLLVFAIIAAIILVVMLASSK